jgi:hypothetical protein
MARIGKGSTSFWCPTTFTAATVEEIARANCPELAIRAATAAEQQAGQTAPAVVAAALNEAAGWLLLSLKASDVGAPASDFAKQCAALRALFRPAHRVALRFGVGTDAVKAMLATMRQIEVAALLETEAMKDVKGSAARPPAENRWLNDMEEIYFKCFERRATFNRKGDERGGAFPDFTAATAIQLLDDPSITAAPGAWRKALRRFSTGKAGAGRLEGEKKRRNSKNANAHPGPLLE